MVCWSASHCIVVGTDKVETGGSLIIATANAGKSWYDEGGSIAGGLLDGISCPSITNCFAVGSQGGVAESPALAMVGSNLNSPTVMTRSLPGARAGVPYSFSLAAEGGSTPYAWSIAAGSLPRGLRLSPTGHISGIPSQEQITSVALKVTDKNGLTDEVNLSMTVLAAQPKHGYWLVGGDGGIFTFGSAHFYGSTGNLHLQRPVVGITSTANEGGYWLDASDGGIFAFGDAGFHGSIPGLGIAPAGTPGASNELNEPVVGMVPSSDDGGYFMVASDGGVFAFGDARFAGSCPGIGGCSGAAVTVMPDATGNGYWLITESGNIYTFGDAPYYGAPGFQAAPVTSAVRSPDGRGYWVLLANGSVYSYGDAVDFGGLPPGATSGTNPANAIFATSGNGGYWVATANGAVYPFGDAPNDGDMAGTALNAPIIAAVGW